MVDSVSRQGRTRVFTAGVAALRRGWRPAENAVWGAKDAISEWTLGGLEHMSNPLDEFADRLQEEINQEVIERYGKEAYARWRNPKFSGAMESPTGHGRVAGTCGDTMEV